MSEQVKFFYPQDDTDLAEWIPIGTIVTGFKVWGEVDSDRTDARIWERQKLSPDITLEIRSKPITLEKYLHDGKELWKRVG